MSGVRNQESEIRMTAGGERTIRHVEDLEVFRRAYRLSLDVHRVSLEFPRIEQWALADQLRRATKSICANIAEGFSRQRYSAADYRRFLMMAIGSSDETQLWLRYAIDLEYVDKELGREWIAAYGEVSRMLQAIYSGWLKSTS
jgi:four helix bundle protein